MEEPSLKIKHWWQNSENIYFKETGSSEVFVLANMLSTFCMERKKNKFTNRIWRFIVMFFSLFLRFILLTAFCIQNVMFPLLLSGRCILHLWMFQIPIKKCKLLSDAEMTFLWGAKKYILRRLSLEFSLLLPNPAFYSLCISVCPCPAITLKSFCGEYQNGGVPTLYCSMEKSKYVDASMQGITHSKVPEHNAEWKILNTKGPVTKH